MKITMALGSLLGIVAVGLVACGDGGEHNGNIECVFGDGTSIVIGDGSSFDCASAGGTLTVQPSTTTTSNSNNPTDSHNAVAPTPTPGPA